MMMRNYLVVFGFMAAMIFLAPSVVSAATFTVTKTADTNDGVCDSDCSLREAVAAATPSSGRVEFSPTLAGATVVLSAGEIQLNNITIKGFGADQITISANNSSRIFYILEDAIVTISGVTLTGGNGVGMNPGSGGAIRSEGALTLDSVNVTGNRTTGNEPAAGGGGLYMFGAPVHNIRNSTFSDNRAGTGNSPGNIKCQQAAGANIYNSTFDNGDITLLACQFKVRNSTTTGVIVLNGLAGVSIGNSIITNINRVSLNSGASSVGNNIVRATSGWPFTLAPSDQMGADPMLGSLQNNGGKTATFALLPKSPAIDAGNNTLAIQDGLATDQRRYKRIFDGNGDMNAVVDIGAYEYDSVPVTPITFSGRVLDSGNNGISRAIVTITDSEGVSQTITSNPFGFYSFSNVYVGNILVEVSAKRHRFNPTVFFATENTSADLVVQ